MCSIFVLDFALSYSKLYNSLWIPAITPLRYSAIPPFPFRHSAILPFCHSTILPFHNSTNPQIRSNKQEFLHLVPHFNKEKHLCTLPVVFGVTDLCLLRKPNISYLDSFQMLWINVPFMVLSAYIGIITTLPLSNITATATSSHIALTSLLFWKKINN